MTYTTTDQIPLPDSPTQKLPTNPENEISENLDKPTPVCSPTVTLHSLPTPPPQPPSLNTPTYDMLQTRFPTITGPSSPTNQKRPYTTKDYLEIMSAADRALATSPLRASETTPYPPPARSYETSQEPRLRLSQFQGSPPTAWYLQNHRDYENEYFRKLEEMQSRPFEESMLRSRGPPKFPNHDLQRRLDEEKECCLELGESPVTLVEKDALRRRGALTSSDARMKNPEGSIPPPSNNKPPTAPTTKTHSSPTPLVYILIPSLYILLLYLALFSSLMYPPPGKIANTLLLHLLSLPSSEIATLEKSGILTVCCIACLVCGLIGCVVYQRMVIRSLSRTRQSEGKGTVRERDRERMAQVLGRRGRDEDGDIKEEYEVLLPFAFDTPEV
jgi:hypothetical protein